MVVLGLLRVNLNVHLILNLNTIFHVSSHKVLMLWLLLILLLHLLGFLLDLLLLLLILCVLIMLWFILISHYFFQNLLWLLDIEAFLFFLNLITFIAFKLQQRLIIIIITAETHQVLIDRKFRNRGYFIIRCLPSLLLSIKILISVGSYILIRVIYEAII